MLLLCGTFGQILEAAQDVETDSEKICRTSTGFTLSALQGKVVHITSEMLKKMKPEELMQLWQVKKLFKVVRVEQFSESAIP